MRVCLINPPWRIKRKNIWKYIRSTMPPLGLLYLAAVLEREQIDVDIADFQAGAYRWREIEEHIQGSQYDLFGITATTPIVKTGYHLCETIRRYHPKSGIVFGGVHATALPEEPFHRAPVDFVVRGDGEDALVKLARGVPVETIAGLSYKEGARIRHVMPDGLVEDLDRLPHPAFHKVDLTRYKPAVGSYKRLPALNMMATRGCPGRCTFCNSANVKLRKRSPESICSEMKLLAQRYGIREISFYDDTFTVYPKTVMKLCDLLIEKRIDLTWCCFARTDTVGMPMLEKMKAAGCHQIMFGIEAADPGILKNIKKRSDPAKAENAVRMARKAGLTVRCAFMFGNPGETGATIDETIRYSIDLAPDIALYNITTPYPGTEMFHWAKANGYLITEDWDRYDLGVPVMRLPGMPPARLMAKYRQAYNRFYFRPGFIAKKVMDLLSLKEIPMVMEGVKSVFRFARSNFPGR